MEESTRSKPDSREAMPALSGMREIYFQIEWREFWDPKHRQTVVVLTWPMLQPPDYIENVTKSYDTLNKGMI